MAPAALSAAQERTSLSKAIECGEYITEAQFTEVFECALRLAAIEVEHIMAWEERNLSQKSKSRDAYDLESLLLLLLIMSLPTQRREVFINMDIEDVQWRRIRSVTNAGTNFALFIKVDGSKEKNSQVQTRLSTATARAHTAIVGAESRRLVRWLPVRNDVSNVMRVWLEKGRCQLMVHPWRVSVLTNSGEGSQNSKLFMSAAGRVWQGSGLSDRIGQTSTAICGVSLTPSNFRKLRATYFKSFVDGMNNVSLGERNQLIERFAALEGHTGATMCRDYVLQDDRGEEEANASIICLANSALLPADVALEHVFEATTLTMNLNPVVEITVPRSRHCIATSILSEQPYTL